MLVAQGLRNLSHLGLHDGDNSFFCKLLAINCCKSVEFVIAFICKSISCDRLHSKCYCHVTSATAAAAAATTVVVVVVVVVVAVVVDVFCHL